MTATHAVHRRWHSSLALSVVATTWWVVPACGGTETNGATGLNATGGETGNGGDGAGGTAATGGSGGHLSSGGITGSGGNVGNGGNGGNGGSVGAGGLGSGGFIACPPCVAPPAPNCIGSGPCGCGPYTCPDAGTASGSCGGVECGVGTSCCGPPECGHCVPDTSGVFCPNYCDYCAGKYQRSTGSAFCTGARSVEWEITTGDLTPFAVAACQDAFTNLPRYCCTADFTPVCP